ncbi:MAG: hypothetical protein M3285_00895 [Actinomycetota bacterium]|nr:hypothetical protein [Actinomycetota bacterium]
MHGRFLIVVATVTFLSLLVVPFAQADVTRYRDGNDAHGPLDIRSVSHAHRSRRLVHIVRLQRAWPVRKLGKHAYLLLHFDLGKRAGSPERTLQVEYEKGELVAWMFDTTVEPGKSLAPVDLSRPNARTLRVSFPNSLLRDGLRRYSWNAATVVERKSRMCDVVVACVDWAPGAPKKTRYVKHVL